MENIKLTGVPETLFIPFYARVYSSINWKDKFYDKSTLVAYEKTDYDFSKFKKCKMSICGCLGRTVVVDKEFKKLIKENPYATCITIGCGFDTRFERLDNEKINWYGIDFPEVIELREKLFPKKERAHFIPKNALDENWIEEIKDKKENAIIILEGILMYFKEEEVKKLFNLLTKNFPHATIIAEFMHPFAIKTQKHHDSIKKTSAIFKWALKNSKDIEKLCPKIKYIEEWNFTKEMISFSPLYVGFFSPILFIVCNRIVKLKIV